MHRYEYLGLIGASAGAVIMLCDSEAEKLLPHNNAVLGVIIAVSSSIIALLSFKVMRVLLSDCPFLDQATFNFTSIALAQIALLTIYDTKYLSMDPYYGVFGWIDGW